MESRLSCREGKGQKKEKMARVMMSMMMLTRTIALLATRSLNTKLDVDVHYLRHGCMADAVKENSWIPLVSCCCVMLFSGRSGQLDGTVRVSDLA